MAEKKSIASHVPLMTGSEKKYIEDLIANPSDMVSDGRFSQACGQLLEAKFGLAKALFTPSCTAALELSASVSVTRGDEIIVPSFTFVSSVSAFSRLGAKPVYCDIRKDTLNIDEKKIESLISENTRAIVAVHYAGVPCAMDSINALAKKYDLKVVEDAAQALGAFYRGRAVGTLADFGCFSFHSTKNIHCGEGGALIVRSEGHLAKAHVLRDKGTNRRAFLNGEVDKYTWVDHGSSYIPSELSMAFLLGQLDHVDDVKAERRDLYRAYVERLQGLQSNGLLTLPVIPSDCDSSYHLFHVLITEAGKREDLLEHLRAAGIGATFHYVPLHCSPVGRRWYDGGSLSVTEYAHKRLIRLPLYPGLDESDIDYICSEVKTFFGD